MRKYVEVITGAAVSAILLFGIGGTLGWWNGWLFLVVVLLLGLLSTHAIRQSAGLAEERRMASSKSPAWDRVAVRLIGIAMPVMLGLASLDFRNSWTPQIANAVSIAAFILILPSIALTYRSIAVNAFFSSHVRIQDDRGHLVVSAGPYGRLRHPGYMGAIAFNLLAPIVLGSWLGLVPGVAVSALLIWRTAKEDRFLIAELAGYSEYAERVQYRLVPRLW